jgi:hypothetical protein
MVKANSTAELEVIRHYLKCEIGKIANDWAQTDDCIKILDQSIESLSEEDATRLCVALSYYYRGNALCTLLQKGRNWHLHAIRCSQLFMSGINPEVNPYLEKYSFNLADFVEYMKADGAKEERLKEFRDDGRKIMHTEIVVEDQDGKMQIIDGSHRAVVLGIRGNNEISCFVCSNE